MFKVPLHVNDLDDVLLGEVVAVDAGGIIILDGIALIELCIALNCVDPEFKLILDIPD